MEMTDHANPVPATHFAPEGAWLKSSYSDQGGGNCVEVASQLGAIGVRDSKDVTGPALILSTAAWSSFVGAVGKRCSN